MYTLVLQIWLNVSYKTDDNIFKIKKKMYYLNKPEQYI